MVDQDSKIQIGGPLKLSSIPLNREFPYGGDVTVRSGNLEEITLGLGVARLLAKISKGNYIISEEERPLFNNWINDKLLPNGLVEEVENESGVFAVTEKARNAEYFINQYTPED